MRTRNVRTLAFLAVGATLTFLVDAGSAKADNWACKVALCVSNPSGPMAVSECVPPTKRLYRHLERGGSFPLCQSADGYVNFTRYGLEWQEDCPEGTQTVYRRDDSDHGLGRRWRYCRKFVPVSSGLPYWRARNRSDDANYQVRVIDGGKRIVGKIITTRAPRRAEPRYLEYVVNGDTHRVWW